MTSEVFKVQLLDKTARCPVRATEGSAGYDLHAIDSGTIDPGAVAKIRTGIAVEIPNGYYGQICSRSSLSSKNGICTIAGVIDSDYRGEVSVLLYNTSKTPFSYSVSDRIAQLLIIPVYQLPIQISEALDSTKRADGGFGSTGK